MSDKPKSDASTLSQTIAAHAVRTGYSDLTETAIRFTRIDLEEQHWYAALCALAGGCRS